MATPAPEETMEPLKYQTWVLKVSIHCQGCKNKVKKVLHSIEGVYTINIDARQQKVIVTGNVEPETLIKKLMKTNRHAELWPQNPAGTEKKSGKKSKNKQNNDSKGGENSSEDSEENDEDSGPEQVTVKFIDGEGLKIDGKMPPANPSFAEKLLAANNGGGVNSNVGNSGGGGGGGGHRKKKKKKRKSNNTNSTNSNSVPPLNGVSPAPAPLNCMPAPLNGMPAPLNGMPACTGLQYQEFGANQINPSPSGNQHQMYDPYYPSYIPPSQPQPSVYAVSYNAVHPIMNHGPYYHPTPYTYADLDPESNHAQSSSFDSFEILDDENPNGCSIM